MRDNPSTHKKDEEASGLTEARGREVLFLPPYSPGYNPI
jgi:transposase